MLNKYQLLFKIYADFECNLRDGECYESSYRKNIKITFLVVLLIKLLALMIDLLSELLFIEVNNVAYEFIKAGLKEYKCCGRVMNKDFNKNLIMSEEE